MKKRKFLISVVVGLFVFFAFTVIAAKPGKGEDITVTTYYPSPHGVYKTLKASELILEPLDEAPAEPVTGMIFFSSGKGVDPKGNRIAKGIWICSEEHWYPLMLLEERIKGR